MKRILFPAVGLMNRLNYLQKFALIGLLCFLPVGLAVQLLISDIDREIVFARKEIQGIRYTNHIRQFLEKLQRHRGEVNAYLLGDTSFSEQIIRTENDIRQAVESIDRVNDELGNGLQIGDRWTEIKEQWSTLLEEDYPNNVPNNRSQRSLLSGISFKKHSDIVANVLHLMGHIRDTSGLKLDPGQDTYYMMDSITSKLPTIAERLGQVRGTGAGIASVGFITAEEKTRLIVLSGMIRTDLADLDMEANKKLAGSSNLEELHPRLQSFVDSTHTFLRLLDRRIVQSEQIAIVPAELFRIGTDALEEAYLLNDLESPLLHTMLTERISELQQRKLWIVGLSILSVAMVLYIFIAFYYSVIHVVFVLKRTALRIIGGDLTARVALDTKDELYHVGTAFNKMVEAFGHTLEESKRQTERIEYLAFYDSLTDLPNRTFFQQKLLMALDEAERQRMKAAVLFIDLDHFKNINDTLGHDAGDQLLRIISERIKQSVDGKAVVSRMGGDEFLLLLPGLEEPHYAGRTAQKIIEALSASMEISGHHIVVSASIGISIFPDDGKESAELIKRADTALYYAKSHGRNKYQFFNQSMNESTLERLQFMYDLRKALEENELCLYYQPRLEAASSRIVGLEALIRWMPAGAGRVRMPKDFIPLAEETGLIIPLGEWVLRTACKQYKEWERQGVPPLRISVNISVVQFGRDEFVELIRQILEETAMPPDKLELELTESMVMRSEEDVIRKLKQLKELGVYLSIDDFGTGYSSFTYLKHFPIDALKIDRSFIQDVPNGVRDTAITKTIIALGRRLGLKVVAEGVETKEQLAFLTSRKCDEVQGYLLSRPLPVEGIERLLLGGKQGD
ncbi:EAL domain-containing protein [Paenibacillus oenotherae]|uniref:EAL domain-containing protein n=1 Tax=Paenibacillus oenotherae TaxID=1435645 RepID=A0ABS7D531_9BACL|nr:EAL domain-containing protein [Paenibacillus oenotherae]MBW7474926.1 EAL domain-containing protein [Paenibacillus oenotherae]